MKLDDVDSDIYYFNNENQCSYYGSQSIKSTFSNDNSSLEVLHLNVRSVKKKFNEFQIALHREKAEFHIIVLTESWLNSVNK